MNCEGVSSPNREVLPSYAVHSKATRGAPQAAGGWQGSHAQGTVIWETKGVDSPCDKTSEHWGEGAKTPKAIQGSPIQKEAILFGDSG